MSSVRIVGMLVATVVTLVSVPVLYPGHLHIDLLPCIQRQGVGSRLIHEFARLLAKRGCPAFHLGVNVANRSACMFYESIGLRTVRQPAHVRTYGLAL